MSHYRDKMRRAKAVALQSQGWKTPAFQMLQGARVVESVADGAVTHETLVFTQQAGQARALSVDFQPRWISASSVDQIAAAFVIIVQRALAPETPGAA